MDVMTIVIVSTVIFLLFLVVGKIALMKIMAGGGHAGLTPEAVLEEVGHHLSAGREEEAIRCLQSALDVFPEHAALSARLKELL